MSYAGFWKRFVAHTVDCVVLTVAMDAIWPRLQLLSEVVEGSVFFQGLLQIGLWWLYFAGMESTTPQGTLGKMMLGIKVTDIPGNRITFVDATFRHFGKVFSALPFFAGFFMAGFTRRKQAFHDWMTGCVIVNK